MRPRFNIIGLCLAATFIVIFGSVLSMALFKAGAQPTEISLEAVAETQK